MDTWGKQRRFGAARDVWGRRLPRFGLPRQPAIRASGAPPAADLDRTPRQACRGAVGCPSGPKKPAPQPA